MEAAEHGHKATVEALLDKGADMNAKAKNDDTALSLATAGSHTAIVTLLEATPKLLKAATANDASKVNEALTEGADKDAKDSAGWTALMWGAWNGHEDIVQALIDEGADVNALSTAGSTALKLATVKGHGAIVTLLKANGATGTPTAPTTAEKTTATAKLFTAVKANNVNQVNEAIEAGANIDTQGANRYTALMFAARDGRTAIAKALIDKGANVNTQGKYKYTALIYAARYDHPAIVKALITGGANVNARDKYRLTALSHAVRAGDSRAEAILREAGATR